MQCVRRTMLLSSTLAVLVVISACGAGSDRAADEERGVTVVQADVRYPFSSIEEKRAFTDAWVAGTVTDETIAPFDGPEPSEGTQARRVAVGVDRVHWRRPGVDVPGEISAESPLIVTDGRVSYLVPEGGSALEVGRSYLLGIVQEPGGTWTIAVPAAVLPIEDGDVLPASQDPASRSGSVEVAAYVEAITTASPVVADEVGDIAARLEAWEAQVAAPSAVEAGG